MLIQRQCVNAHTLDRVRDRVGVALGTGGDSGGTATAEDCTPPTTDRRGDALARRRPSDAPTPESRRAAAEGDPVGDLPLALAARGLIPCGLGGGRGGDSESSNTTTTTNNNSNNIITNSSKGIISSITNSSKGHKSSNSKSNNRTVFAAATTMERARRTARTSHTRTSRGATSLSGTHGLLLRGTGDVSDGAAGAV
jgi:hypothetical protein